METMYLPIHSFSTDWLRSAAENLLLSKDLYAPSPCPLSLTFTVWYNSNYLSCVRGRLLVLVFKCTYQWVMSYEFRFVSSFYNIRVIVIYYYDLLLRLTFYETICSHLRCQLKTVLRFMSYFEDASQQVVTRNTNLYNVFRMWSFL